MAGEAHGGGFPPFQVETFPSQIFWFALTFGVLYFCIAKVITPRLSEIVATRKARIDADLSAAQKAKADSEAASASYEKALADARARAQALAAENHAKVVASAETHRKSVEDSLSAKMADAEAKIAATKTAAMANVSAIASESATAIVEKLMGSAPKADDVVKAVSSALKS